MINSPVPIHCQVHLAALIAGFSLAGCLAGLHKKAPAPHAAAARSERRARRAPD